VHLHTVEEVLLRVQKYIIPFKHKYIFTHTLVLIFLYENVFFNLTLYSPSDWPVELHNYPLTLPSCSACKKVVGFENINVLEGLSS
jgi:hypothetical protein